MGLQRVWHSWATFAFIVCVCVCICIYISIYIYIYISAHIYLHTHRHAHMLGHIWFFVTPWTVACKAPLSIGFSRQEFWSGLPCPPPRDLPNPGIEPGSPADSLPAEPPGKPYITVYICTHTHTYTHTHTHTHTHIYIYRERERERDLLSHSG